MNMAHIFRLTPRVDLIKPNSMSVRPSVCQQNQCQGHGDPKVAKMAAIKVLSSKPVCNSLIKRLAVDYDTPRQYLNVNWTDF